MVTEVGDSLVKRQLLRAYLIFTTYNFPNTTKKRMSVDINTPFHNHLSSWSDIGYRSNYPTENIS